MTRELSSNYLVNGFPWWGTVEDNAMEIACAASTIHPVAFVKFEFDGGDVNLHTELGDITWGGDTYTGVGSLGSVGVSEEVSDLSNTPLNLTLSGIPNDLISILLNEYYQGRRATLYLGYLDMTTRQLVADPIILYRGLIDTADIQQDKTCTVTLSVQSRFAAWDVPLIRRYNNADQQARYPGDKGLQFVEQAVDKQIIWGGKV
jgi:hypothetical protein